LLLAEGLDLYDHGGRPVRHCGPSRYPPSFTVLHVQELRGAVAYNAAVAEQHRATLSLGVPFTEAELKAAYRKLIWQWHPDRNLSDPELHTRAVHNAKLINVTYEFLSELLETTGGVYQRPAAATSRTRYSWSDIQPERTYEGKRYTVGFGDLSVTEVFLKSSHIVSTGYNRSSRILYIKFSGNSVYMYYDVPEHVFEAFVAAPSHGKFANAYIYRRFRHQRC
jgi:hypothetical protein